MIVEELAIPRYDQEPLIGNHLPYAHQIIARNTIRKVNEFFLFITSPTGSGKTDAWAVPALKENNLGVVIALYPTNALAEDQYRSIVRLKESLKSNKQIEFVTAEKLGLKKDDFSYRITKGEILVGMVRKMALQGGGIIITNPDIIIYALKGYFYDEYLKSVFKNQINTVVFDEFHLYDLRQSDIILFILHDILITDGTEMRKFIFLSATPNEKIEAKITSVICENLIDTSHISVDSPVIDKQSIMPEVELEFRHAPRFMAGEALLKDMKWLREFKGDHRMAIIFDSAHEVSVVSEVLRRETDWRICERSGFRKDSMEDSFDVLVGNKAVEVGIDFKGEYAISRLIFSGHSVSEFLQRFGRLRNPIPGEIYKSVCFAPAEVVEHFNKFERISRQHLEENLKKTMHDPKLAENFRWRYGYLEAYEYIYKNAYGIGVNEAKKIVPGGQLFSPPKGGLPSDKKEIYFSQGLDLIREHYFINRNITSNEILESVGLLGKSTKPEILEFMDELSNFRGSGVDIAYYDLRYQTFGTYDAFFLLRWVDMEILSKEQFRKRLPDKLKEIDEISDRVAGYAIIKNLIEKPRYLKFVGRDMKQMDHPEVERKPEKAYGLLPVTVVKEKSTCDLDLRYIQIEIKRTGLMCRYLSNSSKVSKKFYDIDDYTMLIDFKDGSLAIGLDAIYVDCVIHERLSTA
ncbi:MAG: type I-D CRISPR-associated helicase Cas3' [Ruminiclostridium sp.]|nr:type I-D CRISPR-associated helicase Cas3' [Ruminiclostridium sp.]